MTKINSDDYHDFVIKNGKLIGEFDQMYKMSKDIPWHQDKQEDWLDIRLTIELLKGHGPFACICDFGSGLGFFLDILSKYVAKDKVRLFGFDVSPTCCEKAKLLFPNIEFQVFDLSSYDDKIVAKVRGEANEKSLFTLRGVLLYFDTNENIMNVVDNLAGVMKSGDLLLISQDFPPLKSNFVGKKIISKPEDIVVKFSRYFYPEKTVWLEDRMSNSSDNWFISVLRKR
jgi:SAM-dependent methyltransferase